MKRFLIVLAVLFLAVIRFSPVFNPEVIKEPSDVLGSSSKSVPSRSASPISQFFQSLQPGSPAEAPAGRWETFKTAGMYFYDIASDSDGLIYASTDRGIVRYDGQTVSSFAVTDNAVQSLAFDSQDRLYAAGAFTKINNLDMPYIARWDGGRWTALAPLGVTYDPSPNIVSVEADGNFVYVAGAFASINQVAATNVARWDGQYWSSLGTKTNLQEVSTMAVDNGTVYIAVPIDGVLVWSATSGWTTIGSGLNARSLAVGPDKRLYAGVTNSNGSSSVSVWGGQSWNSVSSSTFSYRSKYNLGPQIRALVFDAAGNLYAGGLFSHIDSKKVANIARWNGSTWEPMGKGFGQGSQAIVWSIRVASDGDVYVAGSTTYNELPKAQLSRWTALR